MIKKFLKIWLMCHAVLAAWIGMVLLIAWIIGALRTTVIGRMCLLSLALSVIIIITMWVNKDHS